MRIASSRRGRSVACAISIGLLAAGALAPPAAARPSGDARGATHVHETPQAPAAAGEAVVSLTFDDGPHPTYTPRVLDILASHGVKATFFLLGREAERHPDLVRRIVAEGHAVANHTWDHKDLRTLDEAGFAAQVDRTNEVLGAITGLPVACVRPPYGRADATVVQRLAQRGLTSVVWTSDSRDFEKPGADAIVASALDRLQPGGVILLHDGGGNRDQTIEALPRIIQGIRTAGYRITPVCAPDPHVPTGALDSVAPGPGRISAGGWAADPDTAEAIAVDLHLDGTHVATATADTPAPSSAEPGPRFHGELRARPGPHEVCAYAVNAGPGSSNKQLGCTTVEVAPLSPFDDLRPLAARVRFLQLWSQAEAVREVLAVHDARRRLWTLDADAPAAQVLLRRP